jgi:RNA polymerase sigma-70 factor (ECF subfamily)
MNRGPLPPSNAKRDRVREADEDRALVAKARAGDMAAFRGLVERHQRRAFTLALGLVRDEDEARELVQEAFIRVYRNLDGFEGGSSFYTWLYRIITNLSIDLLRKPGRQTVDLDEARLAAVEGDDANFPILGRYDGANPIDVMGRREIAKRLQLALDELPSYHRAVIVLRELEGQSYEDMAKILGVSKGTIMSRLFHARQRLQRALADCYRDQFGGLPASEGPGSAAEP